MPVTSTLIHSPLSALRQAGRSLTARYVGVDVTLGPLPLGRIIMPGFWPEVGKRITSRIDETPAISITSRSIPMPSPPHGGSPYSSAHVVLVDTVGLVVAGGGELRLGLEALALVESGR